MMFAAEMKNSKDHIREALAKWSACRRIYPHARVESAADVDSEQYSVLAEWPKMFHRLSTRTQTTQTSAKFSQVKFWRQQEPIKNGVIIKYLPGPPKC